MSRFALMPSRFYFHLNNGEDVIRDEEGVLVSDADAALITAMEVIQELRAQDAVSAAEWQGWRLEITDEAGEPLTRRSALGKAAAALGTKLRTRPRRIASLMPDDQQSASTV